MTPRERAIAWAVETANNPLAVICDTETTALDETAEIVDIAVLAMDGRVLLESLCCPLRPIPAAASAIHGLTEKHVHKAPMWKELFPKVCAALAGRTIVAWNAPYDLGVINGVSRADKLPGFPGPWDDAMQHFGAFEGTPGRFGGFKWHRLESACRHLGIDPGEHRARADAEATRQVILAMAAQAAPNDAPVEQARLVFGVDTNIAEWADVPERLSRLSEKQRRK